MKLINKALAVLTALLITVPMFAVQISAEVYLNGVMYSEAGQYYHLNYERAFINDGTDILNFTRESGWQGAVEIPYIHSGQTINWDADTPGFDLTVLSGEFDESAGAYIDDSTFNMSSGTLSSLTLTNFYNSKSVINGTANIGTLEVLGGEIDLTISGNAHIGTLIISSGSITIGPNAIIDNPKIEIVDEQNNEDTESDKTPDPAPKIGEPVGTSMPTLKSGNNLFPSFVLPTVEIVDDKPFEQNGKSYYGTVDIKSVDSDTPQEIPSEVFVNGHRYLVGETIYIVAKKDLEIVGYAETGVSYVFPAVENSARAATFTAEGLPEGVVLSEGGVLSTETLPLTAGEYTFTVTVDNGVDTNTIEVALTIKDGYVSDEELAADLTKNDKEAVPAILDETGEEKEHYGVPGLWINEDLTLHYDPDFEDFDKLFLNGHLLKPGEDYLVKNGGTVIVLTEKTLIGLPNGDYVVTTMFHQDSKVGLDTVINDVGSSSFVFRFGDEKSDKKRVNISGDGVLGSVTFDDKNAEETPITTISANTEAIEQRAKNLSNATGKEIIAAFETKQHGGFGGSGAGGIDRSDSAGRIATFAVSVKSLDLSLKNGTAVYIAVYDSKTGKTYQNKGEVRDGMIVFKTKHSGVFMVSLEKY